MEHIIPSIEISFQHFNNGIKVYTDAELASSLKWSTFKRILEMYGVIWWHVEGRINYKVAQTRW